MSYIQALIKKRLVELRDRKKNVVAKISPLKEELEGLKAERDKINDEIQELQGE